MSSPSWQERAYPLQQLTIRLQGTRHSDTAHIIDQLETILTRLRSGETTGREDDDDFGYVFSFERAAPGPSFFDDAADQLDPISMDGDAVRAIQRRNAELLRTPLDGMPLEGARNAVKDDLASLSIIKDEGTRFRAAVVMGHNALEQANYMAELQLQAPELVTEIQSAVKKLMPSWAR